MDIDAIADAIIKEYIIPVEGFYNFYEHPEDSGKYVKFATDGVIISQFDPKILSFTIRDEDYDSMQSLLGDDPEVVYEKYLGSARLTDAHRLSKILGGREETSY